MYSLLFELHAELLKALAHPRRLEIVQLLRDQSLSVTEIYEMLDLPQANISQHLMILRQAGIVTTKREGKQIIYSLAHARISDACDAVREVLIDQHQNTDIEKNLALNMKDLLPLVHDPVCHMRLSPKTASSTAVYQGQRYYFCASGCYSKFHQDPESYVTH